LYWSEIGAESELAADNGLTSTSTWARPARVSIVYVDRSAGAAIAIDLKADLPVALRFLPQ
jgi:hypothetical protein